MNLQGPQGHWSRHKKCQDTDIACVCLAPVCKTNRVRSSADPVVRSADKKPPAAAPHLDIAATDGCVWVSGFSGARLVVVKQRAGGLVGDLDPEAARGAAQDVHEEKLGARPVHGALTLCAASNGVVAKHENEWMAPQLTNIQLGPLFTLKDALVPVTTSQSTLVDLKRRPATSN